MVFLYSGYRDFVALALFGGSKIAESTVVKGKFKKVH
jgi:hypothetical protein